MQIKAPSSQTQPNLPSNLQFNRYNVCFSYSNSKKSQSFEKRPSREALPHCTPLGKTPAQSVQMLPTGRASCNLRSQLNSKSFYSSRKKEIWAILPEEKSQQKEEIDYIPHFFPQRPKKSGQNQLIKLLLKYSGTDKKQEQMMMDRHPLFSDNSEINRGVMPKGKNFARLNWKKDRYKVNRDKEWAIIKETEGIDSNLQSKENSWLLRANLHPQRLL